MRLNLRPRYSAAKPLPRLRSSERPTMGSSSESRGSARGGVSPRQRGSFLHRRRRLGRAARRMNSRSKSSGSPRERARRSAGPRWKSCCMWPNAAPGRSSRSSPTDGGSPRSEPRQDDRSGMRGDRPGTRPPAPFVQDRSCSYRGSWTPAAGGLPAADAHKTGEIDVSIEARLPRRWARSCRPDLIGCPRRQDVRLGGGRAGKRASGEAGVDNPERGQAAKVAACGRRPRSGCRRLAVPWLKGSRTRS